MKMIENKELIVVKWIVLRIAELIDCRQRQYVACAYCLTGRILKTPKLTDKSMADIEASLRYSFKHNGPSFDHID